MCGFGPRTGARTLAEIGDPHRFANPARLAAYAGLAPVNRQSGRTSNTRRARGGNHRVGNAMFIAAFVASQHDPDARAYYLRKRLRNPTPDRRKEAAVRNPTPQGKEHNAAVICVARRRPNIILAMLKTQTPYQPPQIQPETPENLPRAA